MTYEDDEVHFVHPSLQISKLTNIDTCRTSVVYSYDRMTDWELWLHVTAQYYRRIAPPIHGVIFPCKMGTMMITSSEGDTTGTI